MSEPPNPAHALSIDLTRRRRSRHHRPRRNSRHTDRRGKSDRVAHIQIEHITATTTFGRIALASLGAREGAGILRRRREGRGAGPALASVLQTNVTVGGGGQSGFGHCETKLDRHGVVGQEEFGEGAPGYGLGVAALGVVAHGCGGGADFGRGGGGGS